MVYKYHFLAKPKLGICLNASLKDDGDIQKQVKSLYCAANKLRGSGGVTDRGANRFPGRLNVKIGPYLAYLSINMLFHFRSFLWLIRVLVQTSDPHPDSLSFLNFHIYC